MRLRVLSPSSPDVLALSQGRADLFALRSARVPLGATRIYPDGDEVVADED